LFLFSFFFSSRIPAVTARHGTPRLPTARHGPPSIKAQRHRRQPHQRQAMKTPNSATNTQTAARTNVTGTINKPKRTTKT